MIVVVALARVATLALLLVAVGPAAAAPSSVAADDTVSRSGVSEIYTNTSARQSSSWPKGAPSFFQSFTSTSSLPSGWWTSGTYANGYPFASGWDPSFYSLNSQDGLTLLAKRQTFNNPMAQSPQTAVYPFTSGELRSSHYYGYGCFSTCMKPAKASGVSSSFFIYNGPNDTPGDAGRPGNDHNEVDFEFVGYDTSKIQSNYFSRPVSAGQNSGSGNEQMHALGFDASERFAVYTFKWMYGQIDWFVEGNLVRSAQYNPSRPMPLQSYSTSRVLANIWVVDEPTQSWGGVVSPNFNSAQASYRWIRYDEGEACAIPTTC